MERRKTRTVHIGNRKYSDRPLRYLGHNHPILVQSMTNTNTRDARSTFQQVKELVEHGCEMVRITVPDELAARGFGEVRRRMAEEYPDVPLIADIHFDYRMALRAIEEGADKIRINPGNIGGLDKLREIVSAAKEYGVAIRVGVNGGSLESDLVEKYGATPRAAVESALRYTGWLEDMEFANIVVSIKFSDVKRTIEANRMFAEMTDYPIHLGITEAGTEFTATVASSVGLGYLLLNGIGDTIRVSIAGSPLPEVRVAREILQVTGARLFHPIITVCPTCGRTEIDLLRIAEEVEERVSRMNLPPIHIAVMGCVVNGPGEAREADVGLAGGRGSGVIFRKGKVVRANVPEDQLVDALFEEIEKLIDSEKEEVSD